ncbi:dicarboxylate/amino acid:cation symporter [Arthrobacter crystallopoietes]|uniref:Na+/H+-dicarboxylate symporter n=1 Tax=Crystallibacter crystallopoietes TaxID=37928 RepID=A0A1H0ZB43_9MICC|nr:dicarboxylate/amino acid:cation symporter [Arthrobacter crystallopoietes]AUI52066.1 sodium:proton antiporter [Arthrobacter crystallopoietes]SDQ24638.1 Na+/H+-dicarboxylate symporter [Arthrobacter crystallopoietes]
MTTATSPEKQARRLPSWATAFGPQIIAALIAGLILGLVAKNMGESAAGEPNWLTETLTTIGSSYISLLKAAVVPLIFTAVVSSIANLRAVSNAAKLAWNTLLWFAITAFIAVVIGMVLGTVMQPGASAAGDVPGEYTGRTGDWWAFLTGLFPGNFLGLEASTKVAESGDMTTSVSFNVLQILVISIAVGIAALKVGAPAEPFLKLNASALAVIQKVLWWIIRVAPIGTVGLIGKAVATYGWDTMGSLAMFTLSIYVGLALVVFVVYPVLIRAHGLSVKQWFSGAWPAIQLAFVSRSSMGTMPLTQRVTERNLGVPRAYASFAVPLGSTTKMDGCASIYPAIAAIFVAQFFGVQLDFTHYLLIALVAVLGSAATAGTTGATVMLTLTLSTLGLPLEGIGLLLAIDPILDMGRTAVNVAGQTVVPTIVSKRQGILDLSLYSAKRTGDPFTDDAAVDADGIDHVETGAEPAGVPAGRREEDLVDSRN